MSRIVVTGMGVISALGKNQEENLQALREGKSGISTLENFPSRFSGILPCGEIKTPDQVFLEKLEKPEPGITRTSLLALEAFREAITQSGWDSRKLQSAETAFINGNTVGGMCLTDELYQDANQDHQGSPFLASYDCSSVTLAIQRIMDLQGPANTINTACSSGANAIMYAARMMQQGIVRRAIAGGADSLAKFTLNGFNSLHILSNEPCRPFDEERKGLNLGEAAAFLVLEKEEDADPASILAVLSGWSNTNDAWHASSLSPEAEGPYLAMKLALEQAGLNPAQIGYVNAHGTGTENNDEVEAVALQRLFEKVPPFSSTKSNTGHTLGAAGAVEAVFSIFTLQHQEIWPSLRYRSGPLAPVTENKQLALDHVLSNSFGFGGNCSSLVFSKS